MKLVLLASGVFLVAVGFRHRNRIGSWLKEDWYFVLLIGLLPIVSPFLAGSVTVVYLVVLCVRQSNRDEIREKSKNKSLRTKVPDDWT